MRGRGPRVGGMTIPGRMDLTQTIEGFREELRERRRLLVKRYGKRIIRRVNRFWAEHSLVPNQTTYDCELFPWAREFEENWRAIRAELDRVMRFRDELPRLYEV